MLMFDGRDIDSPLTYNFTISFQEGVFPQQNDAGSLHDAEPEHYDGPREGQIVLPLNSSISGTIGGDLYSIANDDIDRIDVYAFPNITFGIVNVTLTITSSTNPSLLSLYLMRPNCCSLDLMSINVNSTIESLSSGTEINYSEDLHGSGGYFLYLFLRDIDQSIVDPLKSDYANYVEYQIDVFYVGEIEGDFETGSSQLVISESTSETSTFLINKTDLVEDPIEQLGINSTSLLVMVGAILLSPMLYIIYIYRKSRVSHDLITNINPTMVDVITNAFGPYAASYFVIGQNYIKKQPVDPALKQDFPTELQKYKFYLHPVKLSISKILRETLLIATSQLRKQLDVPWSVLNNNLRSMAKKNLILIENKFIDGSVKQVVSLEPTGIKKYDELIVIMIDFINSTPLYSQYIEESTKKSAVDSN
jgi:DNA-binding MarR family transcriptional regulator